MVYIAAAAAAMLPKIMHSPLRIVRKLPYWLRCRIKVCRL